MGTDQEPTNAHPNCLLALLPPEARELLTPHLETVSLESGTVLQEVEAPFAAVYFPRSAMLSLLRPTGGRKEPEAFAVGRDGMADLDAFFGNGSAYLKIIVQIPGEVDRVAVEPFREAVARSEALRGVLTRYAATAFRQLAQLIVCNVAHTAEQRACRWLLMCRDRAGRDTFGLKQQFLADMLGVRRATVTEVAGGLQKAGLIRYSRGKITILDGDRLQKAACSCYGMIRDEHERLCGPPVNGPAQAGG